MGIGEAVALALANVGANLVLYREARCALCLRCCSFPQNFDNN
jgi:NAD(P)-dependent dehydrogenase (short-subunit alcohol dehydrogenase family)